MKVIFGSGIVGLLARCIMGPEWTVVPFKRSRFFSWNPALDDNFIISDKEIEPFLQSLYPSLNPLAYEYKRAWSIQGHIYPEFDASICSDWLDKIFGPNQPQHASLYYKDRMKFGIYDIKINQLYFTLVNMFLEDLKREDSMGPVTEIGKNYFVRNGTKQEFDKAISTIPLDALCSLMSIDFKLNANPVHYLHIATKDLDFEGFNQLLVCDPSIDFFKVTNVAQDQYLVYFLRDINNYGMYMMNFIQNFEILEGTMVENAIPLGAMPQISSLEDNGIFCVGSYAQWDWCADVGSNILRLLRFAARDGKPQAWKEFKGSKQ